MKATRVDPRDVTWEVDHPVYRVYFWTQDGSASDEWRVTNAANVHAVFAWAHEQVGDGRSYQVFVEATTEMEGQGLGLLRLRGAYPTSRQGRDLM